MKNKLCHLSTVAAALIGAGCAFFYFALTVDDAWIPLRYAVNLLEHGEWAFNLGERVNALTSTLHFLWLTLLQGITGEALILNKVFMGILVVVSATLLASRLEWRASRVALVAAMLVASPFVWVWAVGGLETILLLFLITVFVLSSLRTDDARAFLVFNLLSGVIFLARYDSVVFFLPVLLATWWNKYREEGVSRGLVTGIVLSALLPLVWFSFSLWYFHDIFPTSFYAKRSRDITLYRIEYMVQFLLVSGVVLFLGVALAGIWRRGRWRALRAYLLDRLPILAGLALLFGYGSAHSTVHMMFGYRLFLPYLPVFILLVAEVLELASESEPVAPKSRRSEPLLCLALAAFVCFQLAQSVTVFGHGLAGIGWAGEYRLQSVKTYQSGFEWAMQQGCQDIKQHSAQRPEFAERAPRFFTFAEGYIPLCYMDLYVYGQLVSMRRPAPEPYEAAADYVYVLYPRHGTIEDQLSYPPDRYERVSSYVVEFDGRQQEFIIFFNPAPDYVELPPYVR